MPSVADFPEGLKKDGYKWYWEEYDRLDPVWSKIFKEWKTDALYEKSTSAVDSGDLEEKGEDDEVALKSSTEGFTCIGRVRTWSKKEGISQELNDDIQKLSNFMKSKMSSWANSENETKEKFFANVFNRGGFTSGHAMFDATIPGVIDDASGNYAYDSKPFFNASTNTRLSKGGGAYYNGLGALNLTKANLQTMYNLITITNAFDEKDEAVDIAPDTLLCNPSLKFTAEEILNSKEDPTTTNRATNVAYGLVKPLFWRFLTDVDQWNLGKALKGLHALLRENPEFEKWKNMDTKKHYMSILSRFGFLLDNFRFWASANYPTS